MCDAVNSGAFVLCNIHRQLEAKLLGEDHRWKLEYPTAVSKGLALSVRI
jgi:hypothetical protein